MATTAEHAVTSSAALSIASLESASDNDEEEEEDDDDVFVSHSVLDIKSPSTTMANVDQPKESASSLTTIERLVRVHPIWYLPHVGRSSATSLLSGKETGNFIIRQSAKANMMALTVKMPSDSGGQQVEHYLIEITINGVRLEGSSNTFAALPFLIAHYMENGKELECQLHLPSVITQCKSRKELYSYALLGQDFWTSISASSPPRSPKVLSADSSLHSRSACAADAGNRPRREEFKTYVRVNQPVSTANSTSSANLSFSDDVRRGASMTPRRQFQLPNSLENVRKEVSLGGGVIEKDPLSPTHRARLLTFKPEKSDSCASLACGTGSAALLKRAKLRSIGSSIRPALNLLRREKSDLGWCSSSAYTTMASGSRLTAPTKLSKKYLCGPPVSKMHSFPRSATDANFQNCVKELKLCQRNGACGKEVGQPLQQMAVVSKAATVEHQAAPLTLRKKLTKKDNGRGKRLSAPGGCIAEEQDGQGRSMGDVVKELKSHQLSGKLKCIDELRNGTRPLDRRSRSLELLVKDGSAFHAFAKRIRGAMAPKGKQLHGQAISKSVFHVAVDTRQVDRGTRLCEYACVRESARISSTSNGSSKQQKDDFDDGRSLDSAAGTVFSEPWDSSMWENLITIATSMDQPAKRSVKSTTSSSVQSRESTKVSLTNRIKGVQDNNFAPAVSPPWEELSRHVRLASNDSCATYTGSESLSSLSSTSKSSRLLSSPIRDRFLDQLNSFSISDSDSEDTYSSGKIGAKPSRPARRIDSSKRIQSCVIHLAQDTRTFVGAQVQSFIKCTIEAQETDPHVVLGNVRQFINGLKNYLVKQGEVSLHSLIEAERSNLKPTEFLNIDAILEDVLQKVVLAPLKAHIYHTLVKEGSKNGSLEVFSENMAILRTKSPAELGIGEPSLDGAKMDRVRGKLRNMQRHYSPLRKLEYLLDAVSGVYQSADLISDQPSVKLPAADELVRLLVFLLARCSVVGCEIEADYIWGLLHPALLFGEASYYLTALSSAVHVLKHIDLLPRLREACPFAIESIETAGAFLRIAIPDEISGAIHYHCFPALPQISAARLCRMIAHKFGITNPEDHGIYLLVDGFETCLLPSESPEVVKEQLRAAGKPHMFAYKRHEAKIAWPKVAPSPTLR